MSEEKESKIGSASVNLVAHPAFVLVVMSPTGTGSIPVGRGTLVLGRAKECDVRIEDTKLSRRHVELRCGETIELVDLASRNGTFLGRERLEPSVPAVVRVGDTITIGSTLLTLQRAAAGERLRHVWSHGYFEARLEEECAHAARDGGNPFAVIRLRLSPERPDVQTRDAASSTAVLMALDGADMLASYAPHEYEALFTRTSTDDANALVDELTKKLTTVGAPFELAVAAYPRDGRTPEALIERTSLRLRQPSRDPPIARTQATVAPQGAIERMRAVLDRVAGSIINVLILGETGVGKDVVARRIHELSPRSKMPMVAINCGALSESLLESELFGYEKGAFTGALQTKLGLLESANGGTVFLDEVGEMPLSTQVKLLRVLEQREVMRVGAVRPRGIDVRFLAATNRDPDAEIVKGRFRQDLYFRLNGISLSLPPLRERVDEIEPLALEFVDQACRAMGRLDRPRIAAEALRSLLDYQWPGNIRELRNVIERAVLLCSGGTIMRTHLSGEKMGALVAQTRSGPPSARMAPPPSPLQGHIRSTTIPVPADTKDGEQQRLLCALDDHAGNQSQAAKSLGISRATLIRRIEEYGIRRPRKRD